MPLGRIVEITKEKEGVRGKLFFFHCFTLYALPKLYMIVDTTCKHSRKKNKVTQARLDRVNLKASMGNLKMRGKSKTYLFIYESRYSVFCFDFEFL